MEYPLALKVVIEILSDMLGKQIEPKTRIDEIVAANGPAIDVLRQALEVRTGATVSLSDIRACSTVGELAQHVARLATQKEPRRLWQPSWSLEEGKSSDGGCEYPVWFGTNRRPHRSSGGKLEFTAQRDENVHLGLCRVLVPKSHKIGSLGSPWWKRVLTGTDDRLSILDVEEIATEAYWGAIAQALESVDVDDRNAVVFVHGYNVSFVDAALRAAQIGFDLAINGAMTFFSWPSQGLTSGYMADEATIEASEAPIARFMSDIAIRSGARAVHVIAHSMGNRGVLRAMCRIVADAEQQSRIRFEQIILAAPDIDLDVFRDLCGAYRMISTRTTLYVSGRDRAIEASGWLHKFPRVGLAPPICIVPGIDTVNVTNVDLTLLGHGYLAEARDVLRDMHDLITHGTEPDRRFGLRSSETNSGERFWIVGA